MNFRHSAGFGKRMEYYLIGLMLKEGIDCYVPLVDDDGIDLVIRKRSGEYIDVQIKARSKECIPGDSALFSAIRHELRQNYYFVFYSERLEKIWIMSSEEFLKECATNKTGKNIGTHSVWLNGYKKNKETGQKEPYPLDRFRKYLADDFSRFRE